MTKEHDLDETKCPKCGATGKFQVEGTEYIPAPPGKKGDGHEAPWLQCLKCGHRFKSKAEPVAFRNCLDGIRCPGCGTQEPFEITGTARFEVTDEGTNTFRELEWNDDSAIRCLNCQRPGLVREFKNLPGAGHSLHAICNELNKDMEEHLQAHGRWRLDLGKLAAALQHLDFAELDRRAYRHYAEEAAEERRPEGFRREEDNDADDD